jgi:hypothetical protein
MIQFTKPINLNGTELLAELNNNNVTLTGLPLIDDNGNFWLDIAESDVTTATSIVAAHNGTTVAPDNSAAKQALLDRLGLTADEFKTLLGGN